MSRNVGLLRKAVYVVAARRTPCGAFGGSFKDLSATDLAVAAANHTIKDAGISAEQIDSVIIGNVSNETERQRDRETEREERQRESTKIRAFL
jgi:acetyl-CoA acetyltransferase